MHTKHDPCSICEEYIEGIACTKDQCPVAKMKAEIERLTVNMNVFGLGMKREKERADTARAEAIKEFAERLNKQSFYVQESEWEGRVVDCEDIDNLVKEMTEGENG